jgi:hypothetical protein
MATRPKLSKTEQVELKRHEDKMRLDVKRIEAVDTAGKAGGVVDIALERARFVMRALKEARGEDYDKDDIKEIKLPPESTSGNRKKI